MLRACLLTLALLTGLGWASAASAQTCNNIHAPADYVQVNWAGETYAALVLGIEDTCYYRVRLLAADGQDLIIQAKTFREESVAPLTLPVPYLKPFGCPYGPGDAVDYQDYYKSGPWLPAQVVEVDEDCGMNIVYQGADGVEVPLEVPGVYFGVSFRPPELALKTDTELAADKATAADALLCQLDGQTLADITGTDRDADIRRAVLSEMATRFGASRMVVDFINIRAGRSFRVEDGSTFFSKHTDAALGEEAHNIRVQSRVCAEYGTRPAESAERQDDYVCYISNFDEFLCAP